MQQFLILYAVFLGFTSSVLAQTAERTRHSLESVDRVVVRAYAGQLQVVPSTSDELQIQVRKKGGLGSATGAQYQVREKDGTLEISLVGSSETDTWSQVLSPQGQAPEFEMKLSLPPKKVEVFWHHGLVFFDQYKGDATAQVSQGDIKAKGGEGSLALQLLKGRLHIVDHKGPLHLQVFQGKVDIKSGEGRLDLDSFSAEVNITEHKGPVAFKNHSGQVLASKVQGNMTLKNISGTLTLTDMEGSLNGEMGGGRLSAKFLSLQNFSLQNERGVVNLQVPPSSGALVSVRSQKGQIYVPPYLGKQVRGTWTERKGQLRGDEQGQIKILSKYGDVVLK